MQNDLLRNTLTSLEVAEMVEKEHSKLLKDIRRYKEQLAEAKIGSGDFFTENEYKDANNQSRPCYLLTKKGCEFIAHKLTGIRGTEFTAKYINKFHDMEKVVNQIPITEHPGEVANLLKALNCVMRMQGLPAYKIAENSKLVCEQYGIKIIPDFIKIPEYVQMELECIKKEQTQ